MAVQWSGIKVSAARVLTEFSWHSLQLDLSHSQSDTEQTKCVLMALEKAASYRLQTRQCVGIKVVFDVFLRQLPHLLNRVKRIFIYYHHH